MRVRVALRAFWAMRDRIELFNPLRFGIFSWQLLSHKLLRYLSFIPLGCAALLGFALAGVSAFYAYLAIAQIVFWMGALLAWKSQSLQRFQVIRLASYFVLLNVASAIAFFRFLRRQKQVVWQPRTG
jgi:hypothetical protein